MLRTTRSLYRVRRISITLPNYSGFLNPTRLAGLALLSRLRCNTRCYHRLAEHSLDRMLGEHDKEWIAAQQRSIVLVDKSATTRRRKIEELHKAIATVER